jgi:hypothetical protein
MIGLMMSKKIDESGCDDKQEKKHGVIFSRWKRHISNVPRARSTSLRSQLLSSTSFVVIVISSVLSIGSLPPRLAHNINKTNQLMKTIVRALFPFLTIFPFSKSSATWSQPNSKEQENKQTNKMTTNIRWTPFQPLCNEGYLSNWHAGVLY